MLSFMVIKPQLLSFTTTFGLTELLILYITYICFFSKPLNFSFQTTAVHKSCAKTKLGESKSVNSNNFRLKSDTLVSDKELINPSVGYP